MQRIISEELHSYLAQGCAYFALPELSLGIITLDNKLATFNKTKAGCSSRQYKIGSLTKLVTGLTILQLNEEGLLGLEDRVSIYLPWFTGSATIIDLLLHTSGLARGTVYKKNPSQAEIIQELSELDESIPRKNKNTFKYSNLGYIILGFVIETVTKEEYASFVKKKRIFDPLQMGHSGFGINDLTNTIIIPHGLSYFSGHNKTPYDFVEMPLYAAPHASFDMHSSLSDFSTLLACLLNNGIHNGKSVFSQYIIERLFTISRPINKQLDSTIGLMSIHAFNEVAFFQNAEHWGHSASMLLLPERRLGIIAMTNRGSGGLDLWTLVQTVAKYLTQNRNANYLQYDYPNYLNLLGGYTSDFLPDLVITRYNKDLFITTGNEERSRLIYKGRNSFLQLTGVNSKYIITLDPEGSRINGLFIGPYYYNKIGSTTTDTYTTKYAHITGIYSNDTVGRVALFERIGKLILAYSPVKEAILEQKEPGIFIQLTGPFIDEFIRINAKTSEMKIGPLTFKKSENYIY